MSACGCALLTVVPHRRAAVPTRRWPGLSSKDCQNALSLPQRKHGQLNSTSPKGRYEGQAACPGEIEGPSSGWTSREIPRSCIRAGLPRMNCLCSAQRLPVVRLAKREQPLRWIDVGHEDFRGTNKYSVVGEKSRLNGKGRLHSVQSKLSQLGLVPHGARLVLGLFEGRSSGQPVDAYKLAHPRRRLGLDGDWR